MSIASDWTTAIVNSLPTRGVPAHICAMFVHPKTAEGDTAAVAPPPCLATLLQMLPALLPLLIGCIPAAATPAGLFAALKQINHRVMGLGLRSRLGAKIRDTIIQSAGDDQDGYDLLAALQSPLKNGVLDQCKTITDESQAKAILDEYNATLAA
jgi:hypothetical protein